MLQNDAGPGLDTGAPSILVAGASGAGKTNSADALEVLIAQMLVDSHSTAYIVIQIDLPQLINPLDQMVEETLANKYFCTSAQINELRSKVKLIVIVDYHVECYLSFFVVSS